MLRFDRKQQNSIKQLSFNKNINLKKKIKNLKKKDGRGKRQAKFERKIMSLGFVTF